MNIIDNLTIGITTKFIAPMVFKDNITYTDLPITSYITYLSIFDKPEYDDKIIIDSNKIQIDLTQCKPGLFVKRIKEENALLNIFRTPEECIDDIYEIISGRYADISLSYKQRLLHFWHEDGNSKLFGLLFNDIKKRFSEQEYILNKERIDRARSLYAKPLYVELIYGLTY